MPTEQLTEQLALITRGDDAGSSRSANLAIREAWEVGCLRNVSVLACGPYVDHAASLFTNCPGLCVGLHACINCEWLTPRWGPLLSAAAVPSLVDAQGHFPAELRPGIIAEQLAAELTAQLAHLRDLGLEVYYVDEHMCFRWQVPEARAVIADLCQREGLIDADTLFQPLKTHHHNHIPAALQAAPDGTWVLIGHPCYNDQEMQTYIPFDQPDSAIGEQRDRERRMFLDPALQRCLRERGGRALSYSEAVAASS